MPLNLRNITKNRKTKVLHTGYQYEGKLLKSNIDAHYLKNPHIKYLVDRIDAMLVRVSRALGQLEDFYNIAKDTTSNT